MSPPRRKSDDTEDMPAILGLSPRARSWGYFLREVGLPYACVLGIFGFLGCTFYYIILPQNQVAIENQKALQETVKKVTDTNASWSLIVDKAIDNESRMKPALDTLTTEIRGLRDEFRSLKTK